MKTLSTSIIAALITCQGASAALNTGQTYSVDQDSLISVEFLKSNAGARGSLYFLGSESSGGSMNLTAPSDGNNLGQFLFSNHGTAPGTSLDLGQFSAGDQIHFAYLITKGSGSVAPTGMLFRTDVPADVLYFAVDSEREQMGSSIQTRMYIEDIRDPAKSDFDYNDIVFQVTQSPIPAPGPILAMGAGVGLMSVRRRRRQG